MSSVRDSVRMRLACHWAVLRTVPISFFTVSMTYLLPKVDLAAAEAASHVSARRDRPAAMAIFD